MPIGHYLVVIFFWGGRGSEGQKFPAPGMLTGHSFWPIIFLQNEDNAKIRPPSRSARQCASNDVLNYYVK